ncbi:MAG: hypothetical protein JF616_21010 [Fibrobacteres bacterium]|nr:hypothetical protein [Fibrobacterota bacterium]
MRNRFGASLIAAACAMGASPSLGDNYIVDGSSRLGLDALSSSLPATGVQHVRFTGEGYRNPGTLSLTNNGCDSLVFERMSPSDTAALRIPWILLRIQGQRGVVVLRGLALKLEGSGALFDSAMSGNNELILDRCTLQGDAAGPAKALAWGGTGKVSLVNCMFTNMGAAAISSEISISIVNSMFVSTGPIALTENSPSGGMALFNNLFNLPEVLTVRMGGRMEMWYNTFNRTQFDLDGGTTASLSIHNNYFANPPARNNVPQVGTARYPLVIKPGTYRPENSIAVENVRYSAWDGFENPNSGLLFQPGNAAISPALDSGVAWDWRIPGDAAHGAWNGDLPLPAFNLFPRDTSLDLPIAGGRAIVAPSPFPRLLSFSLKTNPFPYSANLPDSVRPWFRNDTLLVMNGNAAVVSLTLPNRDDGIPLLFARADSGYLPGPAGPRGSTLYRNALAGARELLPALSGQNTFRGKDIASPDPLLPGLSLVFSSVNRAGMTAFGPSQLLPADRKWRMPQYQGREIAFTASTTAEGEGTVRFGIPNAGMTVFRKDSLYFWRGGDRFLPVKDSAEGYWGAVPYPLGRFEAMLVERMTFGPGADSLILPHARIFSRSAAGHQLAVDSSSRVTAQDDPSMGAFGAALKFSWPGRLPGDSLSVQFPLSDSLQRIWMMRGRVIIRLPQLPGDPGWLRVSIGIEDSNQLFFVARQFRIPGGQMVNLAHGSDSVLGLFSAKPGDLALDSRFRPADLDTTRLTILAARRILMDSLVPQSPYTLCLDAKAPQSKDLVRALVSVNGIWEAASFTESGGRYSIIVPPSAIAALLVEFPTPADWAPAQPAAAAAIAFRGDSLVFMPGLTSAERATLPRFRADLLSLGSTGALRMESSSLVPVESTLRVALAPDRLYAYRVIYESPLDRFSPDQHWIPLSGKQPSLEAIEARLATRHAKFRHLIGFPFDGATMGANVMAGMDGGAGEILALDTLISGKWVGLLPTGQTRLQRGKGYLLAAGKPFRPKAQGAAFSGLKPDTLRFDRPGWHLIANPLPFPFPRTALGIPDSTALSFPRALRRLDTAAGSRAVYDWPVPDTLQPFEGYLLYAFKPTYLAFDPYAAAARDGMGAASGEPFPPIAAAKTAAKTAAPGFAPPAPAPDALRMTLSGPGGSQSAVFYRSGPFLQTPYMRPISDAGLALEFRAGDGTGWAFRKVARTDSLRIPLEIVAPEAGTYALDLSGVDPAADASGRSGALLDLGNGKVYPAAEMDALPLAAGPQSFVLLYGKAVSPGIASFSGSLPAEFALDQNAPNPFRGTTRIRFRVPGGLSGPLRGRFQVRSLDGRVVESRELGAITVGEHELVAGDAGWPSGVYVYEVRLESEKGAQVMRKKMVCGSAGR